MCTFTYIPIIGIILCNIIWTPFKIGNIIYFVSIAPHHAYIIFYYYNSPIYYHNIM